MKKIYFPPVIVTGWSSQLPDAKLQNTVFQKMASGFLAEFTGTCVDGFGDAAGYGWLLREYMVHTVILDAIYLWLTFDSKSFKHLCLSLTLSNISLSNGFM